MNIKSTTFKEIDDFNSQELEQALGVYSSVFLPENRRPNEKILEMLKSNDNYHLYAAIKGSSVVGISLVYTFRRLGTGMLDYIAVAPNHQRQGMGTGLFGYSLQNFRNQTHHPIGLLIETEMVDASEPEERNIQRDRLRFYANIGAKILDGVHYVLPPQTDTEDELYQMYLMMVPIEGMDSLSRNFVVQCIEAMYSEVYHYENDELLDKTAQGMPETIKISDIIVSKK